MINDLLLFGIGIIYSFWKIILLMFPFLSQVFQTNIAAVIFGGILGSILSYGLVMYKQKKYSSTLQEM